MKHSCTDENFIFLTCMLISFFFLFVLFLGHFNCLSSHGQSKKKDEILNVPLTSMVEEEDNILEFYTFNISNIRHLSLKFHPKDKRLVILQSISKNLSKLGLKNGKEK